MRKRDEDAGVKPREVVPWVATADTVHYNSCERYTQHADCDRNKGTIHARTKRYIATRVLRLSLPRRGHGKARASSSVTQQRVSVRPNCDTSREGGSTFLSVSIQAGRGR